MVSEPVKRWNWLSSTTSDGFQSRKIPTDSANQGSFAARNGQVYGKLSIGFRINENPDDFMYVRFGGVANTNGSRNLEGDPNTLKPQ
jgi:hypothetical protein